ncbi:SDR family NAD(P)-dependent oxidoreductase [Methylibium rhizosphaerae]|jgi:short-subunit dehydrogenase|uniref:SDR family NAD(P)-dependent oxidoreductase n=1 Tax=Methylibium rhizosphaerae TaxID=2570323 RepID=UPI00112E9EE0|nr:SDR family NAD(P)-dependent oxidoreductase [Methylibium rhizosphaerae]
MSTDTKTKGTALITGASSGIGAVYAQRLARRGYDLVLVARDTQRLRAVADRITEATGRAVEVVGADLTDRTDQQRIERLLQTHGGISLLVNNAGIGATQPMVDSDVESLDHLPSDIVMDVEEMVDAALVGFGRHELVTIPSLPDAAEWEAFDAARRAMGPRLSRSSVAARYRA